MSALRELIVLSLEPWDDVWRRNQLLVAELTDELPDLRVLFVEPPFSALRELRRGQLPRSTVETAPVARHVRALRPAEWIPDRLSRRIAPVAGNQVRRAARDLGFDTPVLWVNNHSFARFALGTKWPVVYDITDDWLLADLPARKRRRTETDDEMLTRRADAVVVCSPSLAASRGARRDVVLIPNGVDAEHFTTPQPRPDDLGTAPVTVYVGSLHDERLDVQLCIRLAVEVPEVTFVYVGPDYLRSSSRDQLTSHTNVRLLGPRPYAMVPAYLQHADVIFIPHVVSPFTESLDPIKARECTAVGTPTVATPVAGFRELGPPVRVARAEEFATALRETLDAHRPAEPDPGVWTWAAAASQFRAVLEGVIRSRLSA